MIFRVMSDLLSYAVRASERQAAAAREIIGESRLLRARARQLVERNHQRREQVAERCLTSQDILTDSNERLRRSAEQLFSTWNALHGADRHGAAVVTEKRASCASGPEGAVG